MKRIIMLFVVLFMLSATTTYSSNKVEASQSNMKLYLFYGEELEEFKPDQDFLEYNGSLYVPLRSFAEKLEYLVQYVPSNHSVVLHKYTIGGAKITLEQAKLFAYEHLEIKKVNHVVLRHLTQEEMEWVPEAGKMIKGQIYYVMDTIDHNDKQVTVYIYRHSTEIYFIKNK